MGMFTKEADPIYDQPLYCFEYQDLLFDKPGV